MKVVAAHRDGDQPHVVAQNPRLYLKPLSVWDGIVKLHLFVCVAGDGTRAGSEVQPNRYLHERQLQWIGVHGGPVAAITTIARVFGASFEGT